MKKESNLQTLFGGYVQACVPPLYGHFELKRAKGGRIALSQFEDQQIDALTNTTASFYVKHSDADVRKKAFDCSNFPPADAFAIIFFEKKFYVVLGHRFVSMFNSKVKSLTEKEVLDICFRSVLY
jgi:penicillin-binding protein-related factor A (putative recombinase)